MTKAPKFKKSDFIVGQKVYSESVNNSFSNNRVDGKIEEEEVVSVGNKYVTTTALKLVKKFLIMEFTMFFI